MARHSKQARKQGAVEISLTAMLDMAFQLLAFFVLTFKPAPIEGEIALRMPPPQPTANTPPDAGRNVIASHELPRELTTLAISVAADASGSISTMAVNDTPVGNLASLDRQLKQQLRDAESPFDQVKIQIGPDLRYDAVMSVVDVCTRQQLATGKPLTKLSFAELPATERN